MIQTKIGNDGILMSGSAEEIGLFFKSYHDPVWSAQEILDSCDTYNEEWDNE